MATTVDKIYCVTCGNEKTAYKCEGCSQNFCTSHLVDHRQVLGRQLDEVEYKYNLFRQTVTKETINAHKYSLIQQINEWERDSINKILETANETREILMKHTNQHIDKIETKLTKLTEELKYIREENDFNETDLNELKQKLKQVEEEYNKSSFISIQQDSSPFINKISVITSSPPPLSIPNISAKAKWIQNGITVAGGNGEGNKLNQFSVPWGVCVDDDQTVYVADQFNNRIVAWKLGAKNGQVVAGGNGDGNRDNQLSRPVNVIVDKKNDCLIICDHNNRRVIRWPRQNGTSGETIISNVSCWGLAMDDDDYIYVSDNEEHQVKRWKIGEIYGTVIAGRNGSRGNRLDQFDCPHFIFIDQNHSVYVSDCNNNRVMKWKEGAKEGIVVAGGRGQGNDLTQLSSPFGVIVDQLGTVYAVDENNHRVMRWSQGAAQGSVVVGGNGSGEQSNQLNYPIGLSIDRQNNLYVVNISNHRVQKFNIEPNSII